MAWLLRNPVVTAPIIGATRPEHLATRSPPSTSTSPLTRPTSWKTRTRPAPRPDTDGSRTDRPSAVFETVEPPRSSALLRLYGRLRY